MVGQMAPRTQRQPHTSRVIRLKAERDRPKTRPNLSMRTGLQVRSIRPICGSILRGGFGTRSTCAMWRQNHVSCVAALAAMPITCDLPNPGPSAARSVTNGWCPSAPRITAHFMASVMKSGGGRKWASSQSGMLIDFGTRLDTHFRNGQVANPPKCKETKL